MKEALTKEKIAEALKEYFAARPEVLFAYLFGSFAKGTQNKLSDVDVAVYLDESAVPRKGFFDYKIKAMSSLPDVVRVKEVDLVILNEAPPLLSHQVMRDGVVICSRDERLRSIFAVSSFNFYQDYLYLKEPHFQALKERIQTGRFGEIR
ncbi:MAG TPA: nucleotidyltransferase domain-containing protein [Nitrospirota bacterium]|jgi:predicted nucleotidyltransferase